MAEILLFAIGSLAVLDDVLAFAVIAGDDSSNHSSILSFGLEPLPGFEDKGAQPIQSKSPKMMINTRPGREVMGRKPPTTATFEHVEDSVEDVAQRMDVWSSLASWGG